MKIYSTVPSEPKFEDNVTEIIEDLSGDNRDENRAAEECAEKEGEATGDFIDGKVKESAENKDLEKSNSDQKTSSHA